VCGCAAGNNHRKIGRITRAVYAALKYRVENPAITIATTMAGSQYFNFARAFPLLTSLALMW
jgi:hypothetical protein